MHIYEMASLRAAREQGQTPYHEFLRIPALSAGLYVLPAGAPDPQQPHGEDEVYYVVSGHGSIRVGDEDQPVGPGTVVLVEAQVPHRFHTITEDLAVLVFFAPAEYTAAAGSGAPAG